MIKRIIIAFILLGMACCAAPTLVGCNEAPSNEAPSQQVPDGTYIPEDILVSTNTDGEGTVSFTHTDGIHYVIQFNIGGESNE